MEPDKWQAATNKSKRRDWTGQRRYRGRELALRVLSGLSPICGTSEEVPAGEWPNRVITEPSQRQGLESGGRVVVAEWSRCTSSTLMSKRSSS